MNSPANFHVLERRLRMTGVLETRTGLHIGTSGGRTDALDMPVLKDAQGRPLIPGASLKGVLRSTIEGILRAHAGDRRDHERHLWACDPTRCDHRVPEDERCCGFTDENRKRDDAVDDKHCAACRLFGSPALASHVRFSDLHAVGGGDEPLVEARDGVAIDRDLRTVHGGQKYDFEVVRPGTCFAAEVFVENPEDYLMGLLMIGFDQLDDGFSAIGGFTSRGLGRVTFRWKELTIYTASQLLKGDPPKTLTERALDSERKRWRDELAKHAGRGGS